MSKTPSLRSNLISTLARIRTSAEKVGKKTDYPNANFSSALDAVGEDFVDRLLEKPRTGFWWLDDARNWVECSVKRLVPRGKRQFLPGTTEDWKWFQEERHLADGMTGPDHVVQVSVTGTDSKLDLARTLAAVTRPRTRRHVAVAARQHRGAGRRSPCRMPAVRRPLIPRADTFS